jgi:CheY-like chemotaxis protein
MEGKDRARILVVEDEGITVEAVTEMLEEIGHQVVGVASTGWEAIQKAGELQPDLVLMDIRLKGVVDGVAAAQRIQTQQDVPVVYLTAYSDDDTLKRVLHSRPYGFLVKPCNPAELQDAIAQALRKHRARKPG